MALSVMKILHSERQLLFEQPAARSAGREFKVKGDTVLTSDD